jgi:DNA-binding SARP family transcriptional activator
MQINIKHLLFTLFLFYPSHTNCHDGIKRGLCFHSFEVDIDKRTGLNVTPDQSLIFKKGFSMEFDFNLRLEEKTCGYVFRIICNDTLNVDFLTNIHLNASFSLVIKNRTIIQFTKTEIDTVEDTWIKVLFVFDPVRNQISLSLNGIKKEITVPIERLKQFDIYFGGNAHHSFSTTEVPPMTVKDLRFFDEKKKLLRHWELAKHSLDDVYDECTYTRATVQNPVWEIDRSANWEKKATIVCTRENYHIAFDRNKGRFYFARDNIIFVYDSNLQKVDTIQVLSGAPFRYGRSNQLVFDPNRQVLLSYNFEDKSLATFDFATLQWSNHDYSGKRNRYQQHNRLFSASDSLLVTYGGYGHYLYKSTLHKCRVVNNNWEIIDLSRFIHPRYLGAMGQLDDRQLLYFGGFGSESGVQEEFPRNFYDLYSIGIDDVSVIKIWELPNPEEHFTNSNSLVIDKNKRKFYALSYPNKRYASHAKLHEYSLDKPEYRAVGDSIPYFFDEAESFCDLFQSSDSLELFAVTMYMKGNNTEINIYSIAFPPLCSDEIAQHPPERTNVWLLWTVLLTGLTGIFMIYLFRKQTVLALVEKENLSNEPVQTDEETPILYDNHFEKLKPSSISLLGNFQIVDSNQNEIVKSFTPTTTQLFLLLLMSTIKSGKGITSQELKKILWCDKDDDSARNNRNVYIAKLRSILKPFAEVKIMNLEGNLSVQSEKTVFCDYERALILMKALKSNNQVSKKLLNELVDIALRGTLLPYIQQTEWLEPYQSDYANMLIECLMECSKYDEVKTDWLLLLKISDTILLHDNTDEDAIKLKCRALFRLGRKNNALQSFNKFTADYEKLLAAKHNLVFEELVKD